MKTNYLRIVKMKNVLDLGWVAYGITRSMKRAKIEWEWDGKRFSASGSIGQEVFGQCLEEIAKMPEAIKNDKAQRIIEVWREYHLNDMNAGTPAQMDELKRRQHQENLTRMPEYDIQCQWLRDADIYEVPYSNDMEAIGGLPEDVLNGKRGYRYGERWLFRQVPENIVKEIESW